jgi:outer membrane protein OmpA-like peptidoglycan-associated protein
MAINLVETVKGLFTPELVRQTASSIGENESNVQRAFNGAVPTAFAGILNKIGNGGASGIFDMAKQAINSGLLGNLKSLIGGNSDLLGLGNGIFGDRLGGIIRAISSFAVIKDSSASSVMNMAIPVSLATIGREISGNNNPNAVVSLLNNQKESILASIPGGLSIASALGVNSLGDITNKVSNIYSSIASGPRVTTEYVERRSGGSGWIWFLLIAGLAILAWLFFGRGCSKEKKSEVPVVDTTVRTTVPETVPERVSLKVKLPDGSELDAYRGGIEERLVAFLSGNWKSLSDDSLKNTWFDFDDLNFETGSATITAASQKQVNNLVAILKAFPDAKLKIGGYTDRVGDDAANMKLSQERADATASAIKNGGAKASQIVGAEGYGEQFATLPESASDDARRVDRRIAVSARKN